MKKSVLGLFLFSLIFSSFSYGKESNGRLDLRQEKRERRLMVEEQKNKEITESAQSINDEKNCCS